MSFNDIMLKGGFRSAPKATEINPIKYNSFIGMNQWRQFKSW